SERKVLRYANTLRIDPAHQRMSLRIALLRSLLGKIERREVLALVKRFVGGIVTGRLGLGILAGPGGGGWCRQRGLELRLGWSLGARGRGRRGRLGPDERGRGNRRALHLRVRHRLDDLDLRAWRGWLGRGRSLRYRIGRAVDPPGPRARLPCRRHAQH